MQEAIDRLIEYYCLNGAPSGIIHAVSNKYRDQILTSSRFRGIMRTLPAEHESAVKRGEASVLVAANLAEGYDGIDGLCRFILMPKVPFPNLGDKRTKIRMQEDARSFDHKALVAVVQGAGRGVRHRGDFADTWILDGNWAQLRARRHDWLPDAFTSAYHHRVQLV
jgi:Rad3-related DNA helicase